MFDVLLFHFQGNSPKQLNQIHKLCPYYDQLITSFQDRASFDPGLTSDRLFEGAADAVGDPNFEECSWEEWNENEPRSTSTKKKKKGRKGSVPNVASLDHNMSTYLGKLSKNMDKTDVELQVELANQFKSMSDALGSRIKAAYSVDKFHQFLDRDEKRELKSYAAAQSADSDVE